jgi:serine/threonine protein kinase
MNPVPHSTDLSADHLLGEILGEIFDRVAAGEDPNLDDYAEQYPEMADVLRQALPSLNAIGASLSIGELVQDTSDAARRRQLGDFRLHREIGRGGMGVVYEAEQLSMGRKVALKVLPFAAMLDPKRLARFRNEIRAAATLDHPHIVPIYFAGEERGVHFYAMHLVEGQSLETLLDELRRRCEALRGRPISTINDPALRPVVAANPELACTEATVTQATGKKMSSGQVFNSSSPSSQSRFSREYFRSVARVGIQAGEALQHAHELGIVHRDVKPGNLLLDRQGHLFVADFGLARVEADTGITISGDIMGTIRYMSPEQALGHRLVVDNRTDIYSLGATLYELLTTRPPFDGGNRQELLKQIAFDEPVVPHRLEAGVPAELGTIVMKAMAKDPEERYLSAACLVDDLRRFLLNRPIAARPPSCWQLLSKWLQRNAAWAFSIAIVLCVITIGLLVSSVLLWHEKQHTVAALREATEARTSTRHAKNDAERAGRRSEAIADYLVSAFRRPAQDLDGRQITIADSLERALRELHSRFGQDPQLKGELLVAIGETYDGLGLSDQAIPVLKSGRQLLIDDSSEHDSHYWRATSLLGKALDAVGQSRDGTALLRAALAREHGGVPPTDVQTLQVELALANALCKTGEDQEAKELYQKLLQMPLLNLQDEYHIRISAAQGLSRVLYDSGATGKAVAVLENLRRECTAAYGDNHLHAAPCRAVLGAFYRDTEINLPQAIRLFERNLEFYSRLLGDDHHCALDSLNNLAASYFRLGQYGRALGLFRTHLDLSRRKLGVEHVGLLPALQNLVATHSHLGQYEEALPLALQCVALSRKELGDRHPVVTLSRVNVATTYAALGRLDDAIALLEECLAWQRDAEGEQHPRTEFVMKRLLTCYVAAGQFQKANEHVATYREIVGAHNPAALPLINRLAAAYQEAGESEQVIHLLEQARSCSGESGGRHHPEFVRTLKIVGNTYCEVGKEKAGIRLLQHALAHTAALECLGVTDRISITLGAAYQDTDNLEQAELHFRQAVRDRVRNGDEASSQAVGAWKSLGRILLAQQKFIEAEETLRHCLAMRQSGSDDDWRLYETHSLIGCALTGQSRTLMATDRMAAIRSLTDAQEFLLVGFFGMQKHLTSLPSRAWQQYLATCDTLVELYQLWDKPSEVERWSKERHRLRISGLDQYSTPAATNQGDQKTMLDDFSDGDQATNALRGPWNNTTSAAQGNYVYWVDSQDNLVRAHVEDGHLDDEIVVRQNFQVDLLAAGGGYLYWRHRGSRLLIRGSVFGRRLRPESVIDVDCVAEVLAADRSYVYWKDRNSNSLVKGRVVDTTPYQQFMMDRPCTIDSAQRYCGETSAQRDAVALISEGLEEMTWAFKRNLMVRGRAAIGILRQERIIDRDCHAEILAAGKDALYWKDRETPHFVKGVLDNDTALRQVSIVDRSGSLTAAAAGNGLIFWLGDQTKLQN